MLNAIMAAKDAKDAEEGGDVRFRRYCFVGARRGSSSRSSCAS